VRTSGMSVLLSMSLISLICAAAAGTAAWFINRDEKATADWPVTQGVVVTSEIRRSSAETFNHRNHLAWIPYVRYRYAVEGMPYVGERVSLQVYQEFAGADSSPAPARIRAVVERYRAGAEVTVHYNPRRPESAVLEIDRSGARVFGWLAFGFGLGGLGCLVAWVIARSPN
jgi:hypothetical protein